MKGSTIKRGSTWTAYWSTNDPTTGKRKQHSKGGFRTQREARAHLNGLLERVEAGQWRPDAKMTVRELLEEHWLPARRSDDLRPSTLAQYRHCIRLWIVPQVGGLDVRQLTPAHVTRMVDTLRGTKSQRSDRTLSPRTRQLAVTILKAATKWGATTGLLNRDPLVGYKRPRTSSAPMSAWSADEARTFLQSVAGDRLEFAWALLLTRGLRRGELCGLRWVDVNLDGRALQILRTRVIVDNEAHVSTPKTERGRRPISLDDQLVALLRRHRATQAAERLAAGGAYEDGGWLVADELGRPCYPDVLDERFRRHLDAAGLRPIRLHDCRHTAATLMLAASVPVKVVADMLGQDPAITLRVYAHSMPSVAEQAGAALSAQLLG